MSADVAHDLPEFLDRLKPGEKLAGCYLLQRSVEGAARPIWLAHDEVLGKDISLHFLPAGLLARGGVGERLRQEVKRARQLIHPRILRVYDLIEEEEWAAIAMDTFTSRPLAAVMASNPRGFFEVTDVWPLVRELSETLDEAHRIRLAHGALSPNDVLVGDGQSKVMNFGVSACLNEALDDAHGKLFASPQQLAGARPTPADDIYGLGALLHTLLVGAPPFAGKARPTHPPTISEHRRELHRQGAEVPAVWEKVIESCLAPEPGARPNTCGEVAKQLDLSNAASPAAGTPAPVVAAAVAPVAKAEATPEPAPAAEVIPVPSLEAPEAAKTIPPVEMEKPSAPEPRADDTKRPVAPEKPAAAGAESAQHGADSGTIGQPPSHEPTAERSREATPATSRRERRVKPTGVGPSNVASSSPVDKESLSETVRREEAAEEAKAAGYTRRGDDDDYIDRSEGGPSLVAIGSTIAVIAVIGFIIYRVFFGDTSTPPSRTEAESTPMASALTTPVPSTPMVSAATPTPTPAPAPSATVAPAPKMVENNPSTKPPEPMPPAAATPSPSPADTGGNADLVVVKKAIEDLETQQAKLDSDAKSAELAAQEADKAAAAKKSAAEEADKAAAEKKLAAQEADKAAAEKKRAAEEARKASSALSEKLTVRKTDLARAEAASKARAAEKLQAAATPKMTAAEAKKAGKRDALSASSKEATPAASKATAAASPNPEAKLPDDPRTAFEQKMKELSNALGGRATPVVKVGASPEAKTDKASMELAKATTPKPTVETAPVEDVAKKPAGGMEKKSAAPADESGFANSLGMKFVPLPGSDGQIAIWPTRVRDFEAFAKSANLKSGSWKDPGFKQGPDHPVVNVSWQDAMAFCKWLTSKEQKEGLISAKQSYRLPTDLEWSHAAGLANETGSTPESRDMGVSDVYPWGGTWPPPAGAGNYTGEETGSDVAIKGYNDGFPWTSPVGSFPPNKFGLYDMGGNVWQWCMDSWNAESKAKVLRGASWYNGALKLSLLTSCRVHASPDSSTDNYGFRIVLAGDSGKASKK